MRRMALMASGEPAGVAICVGEEGDAEDNAPTVGPSVIATKGGAVVAAGCAGA